MPAEQEGLKPQPNWREQVKSLSSAELESGIRFFQSRLAALPGEAQAPWVINQLPTSDVGTRYNDRPEAAVAGLVDTSDTGGTPDVEAEDQRQPWQMRQAEVIPDYEVPGFSLSAGQRFAKQQAHRDHEAAIREALQQGRPVPAEVLAEYPGLRESTSQPARGEETGATPELPPSDPTLDKGLKVLAGTLRQVFNDNQRQVEPLENAQSATPPSLNEIISEFGLEGEVAWRYLAGEENKFEAVNADGNVIIEGSFSQHSSQNTDGTFINFVTRGSDVFQPRHLLRFSFQHGKTQTLETKQLLLGYVENSHKISYRANAEARPGELAIPSIPNLTRPAEVTDQLPTSDVGTRIDNNDLIDPQRAEEINSLKRDIAGQMDLVAQNQNNIANPGIIIDMAARAIGLGIADEVSLALGELGKNRAVVRELHQQAKDAESNPDLPYLAAGFDRMQALLKVAEAFGWDKDTNSQSLSGLLEGMKKYISANTQLVEETDKEYIRINFGKYSEDEYEGRRPQENEDTCFAKTYPSTGEVVAGVFDGVGGSIRGADASKKALEVVSTITDQTIKDGGQVHLLGVLAGYVLPIAEEAIVELNGGDPNITSTTAALVGIKYEYDRFIGTWASVGDSRVYVYRGRWGKLEQLSKDQSMVADIVDGDDRPLKGHEGFYYANRRNITDSLGIKRGPDHEFTNEGQFYPEIGDLVILVTDGVSDAFDRVELERQIFLAVRAGKSPQEISEGLVKATRDDYNESRRLKSRSKVQVIVDKARRVDKQPNPRAKLDDATAVVIQLK